MSYKTPLLLAVFVAVGCARVSTETKLSADGSFTRTVKYTVAKMDMGGKQASSPAEAFVIPKAEAGVTVTNQEDADGRSVTVARTVPAGSPPLKDIVVKSQKGGNELSSEVAVAKLPNGNLEYTENLHWMGARSPSMSSIADIRAAIKKTMPERFLKTDVIDRVTQTVGLTVMRLFFGPPEPLIFGMMNPDVLAYKMKARLHSDLAAALTKDLPGITADETEKMIQTMSNTVDAQKMANGMKPKEITGGTSQNSDSTEAGDTLTFAVDFPGKVVSTNGIVDAADGMVYWSLMDIGVEFEDVKLDVVVDPGK